MPIVKIKESTQLEFGTGDIEVAPGLLDQEQLTGAVCFLRREPSLIGTHTDFEPNQAIEITDTPIRMVFTRTESIDVIINALEITKQMMLDKMNFNMEELHNEINQCTG